jgi:hypothetical protein
MYEIIDNNPFYKIFWLMLVGLLLAASIRLIRKYVLALIKNPGYQQWIEKWEFRLIVLLWAGYASWALFHLIKVNFLITGVIVAILIVTGWRSWMEYYAGLLLRLEGRIKTGDTIETKIGSGKIEQFNFQTLAVMSTDGQMIHIPYSKVTGDVVWQRTDQMKLMAQSFTLEVNAVEDEEMKNRIWLLVHCCPWTAVLHPIQVTKTAPDTYRVTAKTIDNEMFYKLENYVRKRLKK